MKKNYIGHISQICGVEEHRLIGGKGDGMRLFQVRNERDLNSRSVQTDARTFRG